MGKIIVVTNNPLVKENYEKNVFIEYYEVDLLSLLEKVRDKIHLGYRLLTHPLSGSVKPNETPYKTIIISKEDKLDNDSLVMIENSILTTKKLLSCKKTPNWQQKILEDFQVVDLSLIQGAIEQLL
jgi:hypothetical protein